MAPSSGKYGVMPELMSSSCLEALSKAKTIGFTGSVVLVSESDRATYGQRDGTTVTVTVLSTEVSRFNIFLPKQVR